MNPLTQITESLFRMPQQFELLYRLMPREALRWAPESWDGIPGEAFCVADQACHLRDIEIEGYHVRIRRLLAETEPDLDSFDSYELARTRGYPRLDPEQAIADFHVARQTTLRMLSAITPAHLARRGTFGEYGDVTLEGLLHFLCSHDLQHLACMHWLLGKYRSREHAVRRNTSTLLARGIA
jgi:hypothetical protein